MEGVSLRVLPLEGGKIEHKREREREREREGIFAWEITQGDRQQGLGFVNNVFFFVKHTNQGEFVQLCLMFQRKRCHIERDS